MTYLKLILSAFLLLSACASGPYDPVTTDLPRIDPDYPPRIVEVFIPSNDVSLTGFVLLANGPGPHPTVIALHGYPGNEKNLDLAQSVRRAGFNVLFFHYQGAWGSQGAYRLLNQVDDVSNAIKFLQDRQTNLRVDSQRLSVMGHSMGGFNALRAGHTIPDLRCVVGLAAANLGSYADRDEAARQGFKTYTDTLFMLNDYDGDKALAEIQKNAAQLDVHRYGPGLANKRVLLIAGLGDRVVPPQVQRDMVKAFKPHLAVDSRFLPGDHSFSQNRIQLQREVTSWLSQHCR